VLCTLTGPLVALISPLAHASSPALHVVVAALAALFIAAIRRVVRPRSTDQR